jgi:hypothetical protein
MNSRILIHWFATLILCGATLCIFYYFAKAITKKRYMTWVVVLLLTACSIFLYVERHRPTQAVYFQEDVLYVEPNK